MTALSIVLPDNLAKESQEAARRLHLTRTEFIRQAIIHELEKLHKQFEQEAMSRSFQAMKKSPKYLAESDAIDQGLKGALPKDKDDWWKK